MAQGGLLLFYIKQHLFLFYSFQKRKSIVTLRKTESSPKLQCNDLLKEQNSKRFSLKTFYNRTLLHLEKQKSRWLDDLCSITGLVPAPPAHVLKYL